MSAAAAGLLGPPLARAGVDPAPPALAYAPQAAADAEAEVQLLHRPTFENPCLSLFCATRETPPQLLRALLAAAWDFDPLTTLKLICNLRGVRDNGRGDREGFYTAALWLHEHHGETLIANLSNFADFGYIKDLPEILYRLVQGADARKVAKETGLKRKEETGLQRKEEAGQSQVQLSGKKRARSPAPGPGPATTGSSSADLQAKSALTDVVSALPVAGMATPVAGKKEPSKKASRAAAKARLAIDKYSSDISYRKLFDAVVGFFGDRLIEDVERLNAGQSSKIGLAAKWCPGVGSSYDQTLLICERIARHIFPRDDYQDITEQQYIYKILCLFRRKVLVRLRRELELPELYMTRQDWSGLPYERVAGRAMEQYKHLFQKHDLERFTKFQQDQSKAQPKPGIFSKSKMDAGSMLPHEILPYLVSDNIGRRETAEQAWKRMLDGLLAKKSFGNCVAVCDVLGCDRRIERKVCVALSLLISQMNKLTPDLREDWVFEFSVNPIPRPLNSTRGSTYVSEVKYLREEVPKLCTQELNLKEVYDFVLNIASQKGSEMVKTIFVLTNKEFEKAIVNKWRPDYQRMLEEYSDRGFADCVPQVVYWNIAGTRSAALTSTKDGIMRLSGYSDELMKLFLELGGVVEPEDEMEAAIVGEEYNKLFVVD